MRSDQQSAANKAIFRSDGIVVVDNFLPQELWAELLTYSRRRSYIKIGDGEVWNKNWHMSNGPSYQIGIAGQEQPFWYHREPRSGDSSDLRTMDDIRAALSESSQIYPTGTPFDRFYDALAPVLEEHADLFPTFSEKGERISARVVLHPAGSGSRYHDDLSYLGSYTFYLHEHWNCEWGGQLFVFERDHGDIKDRFYDAAFDNDAMSEVTMNLGTALSIIPYPNRLVLLGPRHLHKVARVDPSAGHNIRTAIQGFLL